MHSRYLVASLAGVVLTGAPTPESFVLCHMSLDLAVNYGERSLAGSVTVELENWTAHPARTVSFLTGRLMTVSSMRDAAGRVLQYTQDVERFPDEPLWQVNHVRATLPRAISPGGRTTIRIEYTGNLVGYTEVGWLYVKDRIDTAFTILRADALAFPVVGGLSFSANRAAPRSDFTYHVSVRVPAKYVVATGGTVTRVANADGTFTWHYQSRGASPFLNIAIAPFDTLADGGVRVFYFHADSAGARRLMASAQAALGFLTHAFGPLHAPPNVTITEIPDGWGSQANLVGGIIQTASAFRDSTRIVELYHELSHLWNAPDTDAPSPRWNEGLAMFLQGLISERVDGWTGREESSQEFIANHKRRIAADSTFRTVPFSEYGAREITNRSYGVGNVMFATLYALLGETEFNRVVGGYYQEFAGGGTTRDFAAYARRTATSDLTNFFEDWLFTTRWTALLAEATTVSDLARHYARD
jgi:aminopeptidase N